MENQICRNEKSSLITNLIKLNTQIWREWKILMLNLCDSRCPTWQHSCPSQTFPPGGFVLCAAFLGWYDHFSAVAKFNLLTAPTPAPHVALAIVVSAVWRLMKTPGKSSHLSFWSLKIIRCLKWTAWKMNPSHFCAVSATANWELFYHFHFSWCIFSSCDWQLDKFISGYN